MTLEDPHLHVTRWSWALYRLARAAPLMCINCICNRYGQLVSERQGTEYVSANVRLVIADSFCQLERGLFLSHSPLSFCQLNLKWAKYGRKWNLKGDRMSGIKKKDDYKDRTVACVCNFFLWFCVGKRLCSSFRDHFSLRSTFVKAITGVFF